MKTRKHLTPTRLGRRRPLWIELLERRDVPSGSLPENLLWNTAQIADFGGNKVKEVVVQAQDGAWLIGPSGDQQAQFGNLSGFTGTRLVVGDFNGDGKSDVAGLGNDGYWRVGISQGNSFQTSEWMQWSNPRTWTTLLAGDMTGAGKDDILAMNLDGSLELAVSSGTGFTNYDLGQWMPRKHWDYLTLADVDGNGRKDLVGFNNDGTWWVGRLDPSSMTLSSETWAQWTPAANWKEVFVGDFTGDGHADVAGFNMGGAWYVGQSTSYRVSVDATVNQFVTTRWAQWSAASNWQQVFAGDFNDDGRTDVAGLGTDGTWWLGRSTGAGFTTGYWGQWDARTSFDAILVGTWDGRGADKVLGFNSDSTWWLGAPGATAPATTGVAAAPFGLATQQYNQWPDFAAPSKIITPWTDDTFWQNAVAGNFGGDGRTSYFGFTSDGGAWIATPNNQVLFHSAGLGWPSNIHYVKVVSGDFDGDGRTDVAAFAATGEWIIGMQTGPYQFTVHEGATWLPASAWSQLFAGDVNGDGRTDLIGFNNDGSWWVAFSQGNSFVTTEVAQWLPASNWRFVGVGDFNRDGKTDVIGMNNDGTWYIGYSGGFALQTIGLTQWLPGAHWQQVGLADLNGDGIPDIYGVSDDGGWYVGQITPGGYTAATWLRWLPAGGIQTLRFADFNGDSRDDFLVIDGTGQWWVGRSTGAGFSVSQWYSWAPTTRTDTLLLGNFTGNGASGFWAFDTTGNKSLLQGLSTGGSFATQTIVTDEAPPWAAGAPFATSTNAQLFDNLPLSQMRRLYFNDALTYQDYMSNYYGVLRSWYAQAQALGVSDADLPAFMHAQLDTFFQQIQPDLANFYSGLTLDQYRLLMTLNLCQGYYFYTTTSYTGYSLGDLLRLTQGDCSEYAELFRQLAIAQGFDAQHVSWVANYYSPTAATYVYSQHALVEVDGMVFDPLNNIALQVDLANIVGVAPSDRLTYLLNNHFVYGFYNLNLKPEIRQVYVEQNNDPGIMPYFYYYLLEGMGQGSTTVGVY